MSEYSKQLLDHLRGDLAECLNAVAGIRQRAAEPERLVRELAEMAAASQAKAAELRRLLRQIDPEHAEQYTDPDAAAPLQGAARIAQALRDMAHTLESTWSGGYRYANITVRMLDVQDGQLLIEALPAFMPGAEIRPNRGFSCVDAFESTRDGAVNREFVIEPAPGVLSESLAEHADGCCADAADCVECRTAAEATA
jgi:hypothetical protein